jgi:hypothetical protein
MSRFAAFLPYAIRPGTTTYGRQPPKKLALQCFLRGREGLALARKTTFNGELHTGIAPDVDLTTGLRVSAVSPLTGHAVKKFIPSGG